MKPGFLGTVTIAAALAASLLLSVCLTAQTTPGKPTVKNSWTPPKTPWGDPDIQGNLTNIWEVNTPLERPDQFAGRKLEDIKGEELAKIKSSINCNIKASNIIIIIFNREN